MKLLPDKCIDLILCDLPYGTTQNKWDSVIPFDLLWEQYFRLAKEEAAIVLFGAQPFTSLLIASNVDSFKYDWVWKKPKGTGHLNAKKMPMRDKEDIAVFYRKQCIYNPQFTEGEPYKARGGKHTDNTYGAYKSAREDNSGKRYPKQILDFGIVERDRLHPSEKPVDLLRYLIRTYTHENMVVLDNCMGSGSTGESCILENRKFIGIEKEREYYDKAKERLLNV